MSGGRSHVLTEKQRTEVYQRWRAGEIQSALARVYGVSERTIWQACREGKGDEGMASTKGMNGKEVVSETIGNGGRGAERGGFYLKGRTWPS